MMAKWMSGKRFLQCLRDAGLVPPGTRRAVIDASVDGLVEIHTEYLTTDEVAELLPKIDGAILVREKVPLEAAAADPFAGRRSETGGVVYPNFIGEGAEAEQKGAG